MTCDGRDISIITGFWRLDDLSGWKPSPAFQDFLSKGDAPVYLGFGSMSWGAQRNTEIIAKALKMWGGRAVIGKGWGGLKEDALPESVFVIDRAFVKAAVFALVGAMLTFFGFMHGEAIGLAVTPAVAVAYVLVAAFLYGLRRYPAVTTDAPPLAHAVATPAE